MAWKMKMEEPLVVAPEGEYEAVVGDIRVMESSLGPVVRIDFILADEDECDGRQVAGIASQRLSENTKLGRWVAAILGRVPEVGEEVTAEDLMRKPCRVVVRHKANSDGKVFANVVEVMPSGYGLNSEGVADGQ